MAGPNELLTYVDGRIMAHSQASPTLRRINESTIGGFYDTERTFGGKPFRLREHLERLYRGIEASKTDPGVSVRDLEKVTMGIIDSNVSLLGHREEFTVTQVVSITQSQEIDEPKAVHVVVYCQVLDYAPFARSYANGVRLVTPSTYGMPRGQDSGVDPTTHQQVFPLMSGNDGRITECRGANFMFVADRRIKLPDRKNVLPGVSMQTVLDLADRLGVKVDEGRYHQGDVYDSEEAFVSSTRFCVLPVATLNGMQIGGDIPGEVTTGLLDAWRAAVGLDFVEQALAHLPADDGASPDA